MKLSTTSQCVIGLALGVIAGSAAARLGQDSLLPWLSGADVIIQLWTNALRLLVVPLIVAQLFVAIAAPPMGKPGGAKLGWMIPVVFIGLLSFTALVALASGTALLALPPLRALSFDGLATPLPGAVGTSPSGSEALSGLDQVVPPNLVAAASNEAILALMFFTLAFALAARRLGPESRQVLESAFRAVRDALFVMIGWLVQVAPLVLAALAFRSAAGSGLRIGGVLLAFAGFATVVCLLCTAALYPLAALGGKVPIRPFAGSLLRGQIAAAVTRSSLATVPILLKEADTTLGIPTRISALVIPAGGATLKLSQAVTPPLRLLFLAHLLGLPLGLPEIAMFTATNLVISPTTTGVPKVMGVTSTLALYVAAGIPPDYVALLAPLNAVLDPFLTVLNTTGYQTANVLVDRYSTARESTEAPAPLTSSA